MADENDLSNADRDAGPRPAAPSRAEAPPPGGWWILPVLLAPLLVSLLVLSVNAGDYGGNGLVALLYACPVAGIAAGGLFAARLRKLTTGQRIAAGIGMSLVFTVASAALACGGCMAVWQVISMGR